MHVVRFSSASSLFPHFELEKRTGKFEIKRKKWNRNHTKWKGAWIKMCAIYTTIAHKNRSVWLWNSSEMWYGGWDEWIYAWHWQNARHATRSGKKQFSMGAYLILVVCSFVWWTVIWKLWAKWANNKHRATITTTTTLHLIISEKR